METQPQSDEKKRDESLLGGMQMGESYGDAINNRIDSPTPAEINTNDGELELLSDESETFLTTPTNNEESAKDAATVLKVPGLCERLQKDRPYRRRFIHSVWLFWAFVAAGWTSGQMGPSFPDLRLIVHKDLDVASWLFSSFSLGYIAGSFLGGYLYDHFNKLLLIFFSVLVIASSTAALPWCFHFPLMIAMRVFTGIGAGGLDTGGNADIVSMWDEEGRPFMQAMHFGYGFGGILSPLVTEPFLAKEMCSRISRENITSIEDPTTMTLVRFNTTSVPECQECVGETRIQYAHLITGILVLSSAIPFLVMFLSSLGDRNRSLDMKANKNKERPEKLPLVIKTALLIFLVCLMAMYNAVEDTFAGFLMTFLLQHLEWTKEQGSYATSLYWCLFSAGRFGGIFLTRKIPPVKMLFGYFVMLICAFVGLLIASVTKTDAMVLVFIALSGFAMSVIFPSIFTWTEESILEVTGMISAIFLMAASTGLLLNPILLGFLMEIYAPITFIYVLLAETCASFAFFLIILCMVKSYVKSYKATVC